MNRRESSYLAHLAAGVVKVERMPNKTTSDKIARAVALIDHHNEYKVPKGTQRD